MRLQVSKMIDIYICEDIEIQLKYIERILKEYIVCRKKDARIVAAKRDPKDILSEISKHSNPAVFFIDVQLKGYSIDGFELAKRLKKQNNEHSIVFLTSNDKLAYKVFEYELDALDYIIKKPQYFCNNAENPELSKRLDNIFEKLHNIDLQKHKKSITISNGSILTKLFLDDIIYIQAVKRIHLVEIYSYNRVISCRQSLKSIFELLTDRYIYVNKSCIVNMDKANSLDKQNRYLYLDGEFQVEISYRELKNVEKVLNNL